MFFFYSLFISLFLQFLVTVFFSFFSINYSKKVTILSLASLLFFTVFHLCLFSFAYSKNFNSFSHIVVFSSTNSQFTFFFFFISIFFFYSYLLGKFNSFSPDNLMAYFIYYVSFVFSIFLMHANDFVFFVLAMEFVTIPVYLLAFFENKTQSVLSSFKYLIINAVGTLFISLSFAFAFYGTGVGCISELVIIFSNPQFWTHDLNVAYFLFNFFFWIGIVVKFGLFPFHFWIFDIYSTFSKFSLVIVALLSKLPFFPVLITLSNQTFCNNFLTSEYLIVFFCFSILYGSFIGVYDTIKKRITFRKLIAYSSIHNFGIVFFCLQISSNFFPYYVFFYFLSSLFVFLTFFDLAQLPSPKNFSISKEIENFNELERDPKKQFQRVYENSYVFFLMSIILISGLPPFGIFFPKFFVFSGILEYNFSKGYTFFLIITFFSTFVIIYNYFHFSFRFYFRNPSKINEIIISAVENESSLSFAELTRIHSFYSVMAFLFIFPILLFYLWITV